MRGDLWLKWRLILALAASVIIAAALQQQWPAIDGLLRPLDELTARSAFLAIRAIGLPVGIDGIVLSHPDGFRVAIGHACTPVVPALFLGMLLTLGMPLSQRQRLIGFASGVALLTLLNLCRLTTLYYVGVFLPGAFDFAHNWLGQGLIVFTTAALAWYWIGASLNNQACATPS